MKKRQPIWPKCKVIQLRLAKSTITALEKEAAKRKVPRTNLARLLIEQGLNLKEPGMFSTDFWTWPQGWRDTL